MKNAAAAIALLTAGFSIAQPAPQPRERATGARSVVFARHGMVAAAQPLAVQVGLDVLKRGGSAVDAAIATNAALTLMEPMSCGLGGDLFAIVWDPQTKKLYGLNASGRAPRALTAEQVPPLPDGTIPLHSPYAWTVPGCADGWFTLHARFGRLAMRDLLAPTIAYAREGVPAPRVIAAAWRRSARVFGDKPGFAEVFLPGGKAPVEGEPFANLALAATLEKLATGGRDAFYKGAIAAEIVAYSTRQGGFFSRADLAEHHSDWVDPVSTSYRGYTVHELPPPGQGIATLEILNILENFDLARMGRDSADFWHVMVEAKKLAFEDRARTYADPAFSAVPVAALIDKAYGRRQAARIDMTKAAAHLEPGNPAMRDGDTTFLVTADASGMMVALIQSNYTGFGSGYVIPALGFGLQNRGALFALAPGHPNRLMPGKRPFHTIIPAFLSKDGAPLMAFGVMGGDMQPQGHVQVLVNFIDFGMDLQEAGDAPRYYHTGSSEPTGTVMTDGGILNLEPGVPAAIRAELTRRGHVVRDTSPGAYGGYQAVRRDPATGVLAGATEARKDGCAAGY